MFSDYTIRLRLMLLFFTLLSLAVAALNSANARFAVILRDRARSDYTNTADGILDNHFQSLQHNILGDIVFTALASAALAIFGAVITFHPRWLRENGGFLKAYAILQVVMGFIMIFTGGYIADHVHGFQTSFKKFAGHDSIPYYGMMYYGGVAQAGYGSVLVFLAITAGVLYLVADYYEAKRYRAEAAASQAAPVDNSGKEFTGA